MDFSKLIDLVKQPGKVLLGLGLAGLLIIFCPHTLATRMGLMNLRASYMSWISVVTIVFLMLALVDGVSRFLHWRKAEIAKWQFADYIPSLSAGERFYLAYCLSRRQTTIFLTVIDSNASSLCEKGFMFGSSGFINNLARAYIIPPHVWKFLHQHSEWIVPSHALKIMEPQFLEFESQTRRRVI